MLIPLGGTLVFPQFLMEFGYGVATDVNDAPGFPTPEGNLHGPFVIPDGSVFERSGFQKILKGLIQGNGFGFTGLLSGRFQLPLFIQGLIPLTRLDIGGNLAP